MSTIPHEDLKLAPAPEPIPAERRSRRLVTALLSASPVAVAVPLLATGAFLTIDNGIAEWGAALAPGWFVSSMRSITHLGGGEIVYPIAAAAAIAVYRRRDWQGLSFLGMAVVGQSLLSNSLKVLFTRDRPELAQLAEWTGWSFPSGHTIAAAAVLMAVALAITRQRSPSTQLTLGAVAATLAAVVGLSRVVLGVHWTSDVVAGLVLGWAWVAVSYWVTRRLAAGTQQPASTG